MRDPLLLKKSEAEKCIEEVKEAVAKWHCFAEEAGVSLENMERIKEFLV